MVAGVGVTAACLLPGGASATPQHRHCVVYNNLTEQVLESHYNDVPPAGLSVGDSGTYHNHLMTRNGTVIADVTGNSVAVYQDGNHLWTVMTNTDVLENGNVISAGLNDTAELLAGKWLSLPATGVSGELRGKTGTRSFKKRLDTPDLYDSRLELC